jgi:putative ABC transport system permease protein
VPAIEAVADTGLKGQGNLPILAVDMTGDGSLRDYQVAGQADVVEDPLMFLAQPDSLIVSREFAARNRLAVNDALPMRTMDGEKRFTIRGIIRSGGLASAFGRNLAVMDIYAAQKVFGRGRTFDRIDLAAREGVSIERCQAELRKLLGSGFEVEPPSSCGQQFESMLRVYTLSVNVSSLFALLIGMFIIYNSLLIEVTQRRAEIGILRSLGATRMQIQMLFLGESAVAGIVGSALGAVCGLLIAKGLAGSIAGIARTLRRGGTD